MTALTEQEKNKEYEKQGDQEELEVEEVLENPEIPPRIEKAGISVIPTQFTTQVSDDKGKPLIQAPATQAITISIPATQKQLEDWTKGSPVESLTWYAFFWLRLIKKALYYGWKVLFPNQKRGVQEGVKE